jgi:NADPH:quinone reductase-like Zn-dependent oxidoreductase
VTDIIGLEASGEIVEVGNEAKQQWNNGDKVGRDFLRSSLFIFCQVMVLVAGGGYAEYVTVHMGSVMKIPKGISIVDAAG